MWKACDVISCILQGWAKGWNAKFRHHALSLIMLYRLVDEKNCSAKNEAHPERYCKWGRRSVPIYTGTCKTDVALMHGWLRHVFYGPGKFTLLFISLYLFSESYIWQPISTAIDHSVSASSVKCRTPPPVTRLLVTRLLGYVARHVSRQSKTL